MEEEASFKPREFAAEDSKPHSKKRKYMFIYGNYHAYYGYRLDPAVCEDPRIKAFNKEWFQAKDCLDIGCNEGLVTISIAKKFGCNSILGVDIDSKLIGKARQNLRAVAGMPAPRDQFQRFAEKREKWRKRLANQNVTKNPENPNSEDSGSEDHQKELKEASIEDSRLESPKQVSNSDDLDGERERKDVPQRFGGNEGTESKCKRDLALNADSHLLERVSFKTENFLESSAKAYDRKFDAVLCLSVTKWIHLNWGDEGIIRLFYKIWRVLKPGGVLLLEPQPWSSYEKKRLVSEEAVKNFRKIVYRPDQFGDILLDKIGFRTIDRLGTTDSDSAKGFDRPIYLLRK